MKIALAQIDTTVGALEGNRAKILDVYAKAAGLGAELVVFPELALTGYPPKDLLELPDFVRRGAEAIESLAREMTGPGAVVGYVQPSDDGAVGKGLYNAAALIDGGRILSRHYKTLLPTYDVFDEARYFDPAPAVQVAGFRGQRLAITICEDFWNNTLYAPRRLYHRDPVDELAAQGVDLMIHVAASPFSVGKRRIKAGMYEAATRKWGVPLVQVNLVGGNDNLIFDGWSNVWSAKGAVVLQGAEFAEELLLWDSAHIGHAGGVPAETCDRAESIYNALTLGIRDYVHKCGFRSVLVGLSGGIDSALTATLAADALGPENVVGVSMPSGFSSQHSRDDARDLAENLGIACHTVPIEPIVAGFLGQLEPLFQGTPFGLAEENLQARVRGTVLMALSNKFNWLVLSTGNKSELAVGYCTLYGDMNGGLSVLGDVLKTQVYELAAWANRDRVRIPLSTIQKPPSAELRPDQLDTDSLPPYDLLDPVIAAYVEEQASPEEIIGRALLEEDRVRRILRMIDNSEYKRAQAAVTLKITNKAFGSGRRMPIARGK